MTPPEELIEEKEEETQEETEETSEETSKEESEKDDKDSDVDLDKAKELYRALNNPRTAGPVIEMLAREAGLLKGNKELTPKEEAKAKRSLRDIVKERLGDDLGFLSDKLSDVIEGVLEAHGQETNERFARYEADKAKDDVNRAVESLYSKYEDAIKYESKILELMDEFTPGKGVKMGAYMEKLYKLAKSEASELSAKDKMAKKLKSNSDDATARLSSSSTRETTTKDRPPKARSLDDAIDLAVKDLKLE